MPIYAFKREINTKNEKKKPQLLNQIFQTFKSPNEMYM